MIGRRIRTIGEDERGLYAVEFALILVPFITLVIGGWEMARVTQVSSAVQGVVIQAARKAGLENATAAAVKTYVDNQLSGYAPSNKISLTIDNFRKFSGIGTPEKITTDTAPLGTYNSTDCYIDSNSNGVYDMQQGSSGVGGAEDALRVRVTVEMERLTPVGGWIGIGNTYQIDRTTLVQAEPYAGTVDPPTRCS
jgi:Flp pilus assembly protein TadG